jgi:hypothetical protein
MMNDKKLDFSRLGFDHYQSVDLRILMSLETPGDIQEWIEAVGPDDVFYGLSLIECAALAALDEDVAAMTAYPDAMAVIQKAK